VNLAQSRGIVQFERPVPLEFEVFNKRIKQVGFTLNRITLEAFGAIREKGAQHVLAVHPTGQELPLRLNPVGREAAGSKDERIWVRGVVHGWKGEGGKSHLVLQRWGLVPEALIAREKEAE